jgi:hypothetical protein
MLKPRAGNSTAEEMVPLLYFLLRQSKMHTKEGNLVMEDFLLLAVWCWLVALVLVLAFVLAPPAPRLQYVFVHCQMIASNSSLQDWHALLLDKEPWFDSLTGSSLAAAHGADS